MTPFQHNFLSAGERAWRGNSLLRYVGTVGFVLVCIELIQVSGLPNPYAGVLGMGIVLLCSWFAGLGPALLIPVLLLILTRIEGEDPSRWASIRPNELLAFTIITTLAAAFGLAGAYRRRIRTVTQEHAQKLKDQARALSQAPIVFRDLAGQIREWPEGAEKLFGWTSDEALGQTQHDLLRTRFPVPEKDIQEGLSRKGQWQGEVIQYHRSGEQLHVAVQWILYHDTSGEPIGIAELHNDVSRLRRAEATLREADRRKEEFLALLAHEIRNPLAPIRTGLELMKLIGHDPTEREETRQIMLRQLEQLVTLVDDLLDVSRISRGKLELRQGKVVLSDIIRSAVEAADSNIAQAEHQLKVEIPEQPIHLHADPHRLAQVVSNLLDNAVKYTPPGGRIWLSVQQLGSEVAISIRDNGSGVSADMLNDIFEMFTRGDRNVEKSCSGLGIGLALVKSIVEMHGGQIAAASEGTDRGSEFTIRLPIMVQSAASAHQEVDELPTELASDRRVLIVDDNVAAANLLSILVRNLGNEVLVANDGLEAIEVAGSFQPEVVLMDLGMPQLDGYGAARQIRQQPWGQDMLLVALSGWGQESHKKKALDAGFDHHLVKPANLDEIQRLLATASPRESFPAANVG